MPRPNHDAIPPPGWPPEITYLTSSRLSPTFPPSHLPYIRPPQSQASPSPQPEPKHIFPSHNLKIRLITDPAHPCRGHYGLFAVKRIEPRTMIIPYLGVIHSKPPDGRRTVHDDSDYDLSLLRRTISVVLPVHGSEPTRSSTNTKSDTNEPLSASPNDIQPCPTPSRTDVILDIAIDASTSGNAARMINDYRNIPISSNGSVTVSKVNARNQKAGKKSGTTKDGRGAARTSPLGKVASTIPESKTIYATRPNVEFRLVGGHLHPTQRPPTTNPNPKPKPTLETKVEGHLPPHPHAEPLRMEVWTLDRPIEKGQEVLLNYGKGFHAARLGG